MLRASAGRLWRSRSQQPARLVRGWASEAESAKKDGIEEEAASWFKSFAKSKLNVILTGGLVLLGVNFAGTAAFNAYYQHQVVSTLLKGVTPAVEYPSPIARQPLREKIINILKPKEPTRFYHIITGSAGSGKSTLVKEACVAIGGGVGYVDVGPAFEVDWGQDLGNAFNFRFEEHMTMFNIATQTVLGTKVKDRGEEHPLSSLRRSAEALHSAAEAYKRKTGRPFVLVIDSVDRLAKDEGSRTALEALIEYAREWAQAGIISCVFVTSDWSTVNQLRGVQPGSRAAPPMHVDNVTPQEALQYLESLGVTGKLAEQCLGLVGGALLLLERCAGMVKAGTPFPAIRQVMLNMIEHGFETAGLLDATTQQESGLAVIEALLKNKEHSIPASQWRSLVPDKDCQHKLLKGGVLKFRHDEVSFESQLALAYARDCLHGRLSPEEQEKHASLATKSPLARFWWHLW
ncbi:hypothetical protein N2152v2_010627 [Parachlorella kessleri]